MIERHLMKLRARNDVDAREEAAIRDALDDVRVVEADTVVIRPGQDLDHSTLLLDGLACRRKDLRDGRRQVTELHVAGDFLDLHSFTLKRLDHEVVALTRCRIATMPHRALLEITERHPHLARVYWFGTNLDAAVHREWAVSLGARSAKERMAHLFCELEIRLGLVGLVQDNSYPLDLTQGELAECLGITPVHVNRTLMDLRSQALVEFRDQRVTIPDRAALCRAADFDPSYLYLEKRPR